VLFWSYLYFATQTCQPAGWYPKPFLLIQKKFKSLHYLHNKAIGEKSKLALPELILLEFNLPRINGHEVLNYIKENEILKHIPVIMLTTSSSIEDVSKSYQRHFNCYIVKPMEVNDFLKAITQIENFWLNIVKLPPKRN
jgi:CheY-like chemotaxis protein